MGRACPPLLPSARDRAGGPVVVGRGGGGVGGGPGLVEVQLPMSRVWTDLGTRTGLLFSDWLRGGAARVRRLDAV